MLDTIEVRAGEIRQDETAPRRLRGVVIRYGERARIQSFEEVIQVGAFGNVEALDVILNFHHERTRPLVRTGGGGLVLRDLPDQLEMEAILPDTSDADDALELVRRGVLRGLSVEMAGIEDEWHGHLRIIHRARLAGIGLVDSGAYAESTVQARARAAPLYITTRAVGVIPYGELLECRCHKSEGAACEGIVIEQGAFNADVDDGAVEILGIVNEYKGAVSSKKRGTLRFKETDAGLEYEMDLPDTSFTRDLLEQAKTGRLIGRPIFRQDASTYTGDGPIARYSRMRLRAIQLGITDADAGWPLVELIEPKHAHRSDPVPEHDAQETKEVRIWL